jgi:guanine deaminase
METSPTLPTMHSPYTSSQSDKHKGDTNKQTDRDIAKEDVKRFLSLAGSLALSNVESGNGGPFGAVIVSRDGQIIAQASNAVLQKNDPTAHAEIEAIRLAGAVLGRPHLHDCILFTSCEPCPMCLAAILWARIPVFYYANSQQDAAAIGFDDASFYAQIRLSASERDIISHQIPSIEAAQAFAAWAAKANKTTY